MLATPYCSLDSRYATQPRELPETHVPCYRACKSRARKRGWGQLGAGSPYTPC